MEKLVNVDQKTPKQPKTKSKKPIKVVYISNPIMVSATPEEFRDVVQRLTGKDSNVAELAMFPSIYDTKDSRAPPGTSSGAADEPARVLLDSGADYDKSFSTQFEAFEEEFSQQMLDSFLGF